MRYSWAAYFMVLVSTLFHGMNVAADEDVATAEANIARNLELVTLSTRFLQTNTSDIPRQCQASFNATVTCYASQSSPDLCLSCFKTLNDYLTQAQVAIISGQVGACQGFQSYYSSWLKTCACPACSSSITSFFNCYLTSQNINCKLSSAITHFSGFSAMLVGTMAAVTMVLFF